MNGREVNRSGFLVDKDGNIVDRKGRRLFSRRHLLKNDDLPHLLNYKGNKFDIREVTGFFDRDSKTGDPLIIKQGEKYFDKEGR